MQIETNEFQREVKKHGEASFPILVSHEQLSHYESNSFLWHWHPEFEFTIITSGCMEYQINKQCFRVKKNSVIFCNANALHTGHMFQSNDCQYVSITFDPKLIYGFHSSILEQKYIEPITQNFSLSGLHLDQSMKWHKNILDILKEIVFLYEEQSPMYEINIMICLQQLWKTLYENCKDIVVSGTINQITHNRILTMMHYIELHYMEKITLDDFSNLLHLSTNECSRLFKRCMNTTLFTFLQEYRIERSIELLLNSDFSITEVAEKCGFSDSNYYTKTFAKLKGFTPSVYRRNHPGF